MKGYILIWIKFGIQLLTSLLKCSLRISHIFISLSKTLKIFKWFPSFMDRHKRHNCSLIISVILFQIANASPFKLFSNNECGLSSIVSTFYSSLIFTFASSDRCQTSSSSVVRFAFVCVYCLHCNITVSIEPGIGVTLEIYGIIFWKGQKVFFFFYLTFSAQTLLIKFTSTVELFINYFNLKYDWFDFMKVGSNQNCNKINIQIQIPIPVKELKKCCQFVYSICT